MNADISAQLAFEQNLRNAYTEFRKKKGLPTVDLIAQTSLGTSATEQHKMRLCMESLLECFQARRVDPNSYELDEVSCYRGTLLEGIGIRQEGRYPRKQKDELGIQRKRGFSNVPHHGFTRGIESMRLGSAGVNDLEKDYPVSYVQPPR